MTDETRQDGTGPNGDALEVTTPEGYVINLESLIAAAQGIRRNALADAEHERVTGISRIEVACVLMGMRIAVGELCGKAAGVAFDERVSGPGE